ncbi:TRAM domain-containing protein [Candidatus Micrarchaeota archaeon]|nr:TRAM domain-containing protein [Candidatus Micrarchaeota archaeon]
MYEGRGNRRDYGGRRGGRFDSMPKPVNVGDVIDVTIEAVGSKGDGIAKKEGFVIFVKGGEQGQTIKVKITGVGRSSATAEPAEGAASNDASKETATEETSEESSEAEEEAPADSEDDSGEASEESSEAEEEASDETEEKSEES